MENVDTTSLDLIGISPEEIVNSSNSNPPEAADFPIVVETAIANTAPAVVELENNPTLPIEAGASVSNENFIGVNIQLSILDGSIFDDWITLELTEPKEEFHYSINGYEGEDILTGSGGDDYINGGEDDDFINGGAGNDVLTGGAGSDRFIFDVPTGIDTITDFTTGEDKIVLAVNVFPTLANLATAEFTLVPEAFAVVDSDAAAQTSNAAIVYNSVTGSLFYNENGNLEGFGAGSQFANLSNLPTLTPTDIQIQGLQLTA